MDDLLIKHINFRKGTTIKLVNPDIIYDPAMKHVTIECPKCH